MNALCLIDSAEEVIRKWLKGVEGTAVDREREAGIDDIYNGWSLSHRPHPPLAAEQGEGADYLNSLDWGRGSVADNARSVVESLLQKDLPNPHSQGLAGGAAARQRSHDPRVTMEMRHQKVEGSGNERKIPSVP